MNCSAPGVPVVPNDVRFADLAIFLGIQTHSSCRDDAFGRPNLYGGAALSRSPSISRRISWDNSFGTATSAIWYDVAAMAHDPGADRAIHFNGDAFLSRRHALRISLD
jgi:hypothetical protein